MAAQLRETYQGKETEELVELGGKTTLTDTAYEVLEEILVSRGVNIDSIRSLRTKNAEHEKLQDEALDLLASIPRRLLAKLIDTWGILLLIAILAMPLSSVSPELVKQVDVVLVVVWLAYFFFKDGLAGQSLGKRMMKIRVVNHDTNKPCTFGQSFWRNLAGIFVFDWLFALGKKRMRLGDMIANTQVVNVNAK
jgi:uncharacterized RDD family membrane protein YckC